MTTIKPGDNVNLRMAHNELVVGEIVATHVPDVFSEGWTVTALVTEGGHPWFGQLHIFRMDEISLTEEVPA